MIIKTPTYPEGAKTFFQTLERPQFNYRDTEHSLVYLQPDPIHNIQDLLCQVYLLESKGQLKVEHITKQNLSFMIRLATANSIFHNFLPSQITAQKDILSFFDSMEFQVPETILPYVDFIADIKTQYGRAKIADPLTLMIYQLLMALPVEDQEWTFNSSEGLTKLGENTTFYTLDEVSRKKIINNIEQYWFDYFQDETKIVSQLMEVPNLSELTEAEALNLVRFLKEEEAITDQEAKTFNLLVEIDKRCNNVTQLTLFAPELEKFNQLKIIFLDEGRLRSLFQKITDHMCNLLQHQVMIKMYAKTKPLNEVQSRRDNGDPCQLVTQDKKYFNTPIPFSAKCYFRSHFYKCTAKVRILKPQYLATTTNQPADLWLLFAQSLIGIHHLMPSLTFSSVDKRLKDEARTKMDHTDNMKEVTSEQFNWTLIQEMLETGELVIN